MNKHLCWTCALVGTNSCPKWKSEKPNGFVYRERKISGEKYMGVTVLECPCFSYEGDCTNCIRNIEHKNECLYDSCKYHKRIWEGHCAQENWLIATEGKE